VKTVLKKERKMKRIAAGLVLAAAAALPLQAQWQEFSTGPGESVWATSILTEILGGAEVAYGPGALFDGDFSTPWVEGAEGAGIGESVTILLKEPVSEIVLVNGFAASDRLFLLNNRIRVLTLSLLAGFTAPGLVSERDFQLYLVKENFLGTWPLEDLKDRQSFVFPAKGQGQEDFFYEVLEQFKDDQDFLFGMIREELGDLYQEENPLEAAMLIQEVYGFLALRLTIEEVYPGSRYDDTCLSEIILR
jgi:hypothetical protein